MTSAVATRIVPSHCIGRGVQSGPGFNVPVSVATAPGGRMYVVCRANMFQARRNYIRITMCTIDEEFLGQFTTFGQGDGQLTWPTSVAVSKDKVFIFWYKKQVMILKGQQARKFIDKIAHLNGKAAQLVMAKITGHFKHGNEH